MRKLGTVGFAPMKRCHIILMENSTINVSVGTAKSPLKRSVTLISCVGIVCRIVELLIGILSDFKYIFRKIEKLRLDIGTQNVQSARAALKKVKIPIVATDVGKTSAAKSTLTSPQASL